MEAVRFDQLFLSFYIGENVLFGVFLRTTRTVLKSVKNVITMFYVVSNKNLRHRKDGKFKCQVQVLDVITVVDIR